MESRKAGTSRASAILVRYVRINRFAELTGYTEDAVRSKIKEGVWRERQHYRRAPDSRILIDLIAFEDWVEGR